MIPASLRWRIYWALRDGWARISYLVFDGCERCGSLWRVRWESSRTCYHYEGIRETPDDPNRRRRFCRPCAEEHHEAWDSMWADYYSGRY